MGKSYTELKKEFEQEWAKNLKLYIEAGMSPEFIAAMREYDEAVFRKERTFQDKTPSRIEYWDDPRMDNPVEYFSRLWNDLDTQLEDIHPGLSQMISKKDKQILVLISTGLSCKCQRKSEPGAHEKVSHKRPRKSEPERSRIVEPVC